MKWRDLLTTTGWFFFYYSFGVDGLKSFIRQDDKKVIEKILFGTEQLTRIDNEITLENIKFSLNPCKNLTKNELDNLRDTARDFFLILFNLLEISLKSVIL